MGLGAMHPTTAVKVTATEMPHLTVTLAFGATPPTEYSAMAMLATAKVTEDTAQSTAHSSAAMATTPPLLAMEQLALVSDQAVYRVLLHSRGAAVAPVEPPDPVPVPLPVPAGRDVLMSLWRKTRVC